MWTYVGSAALFGSREHGALWVSCVPAELGWGICNEVLKHENLGAQNGLMRSRPQGRFFFTFHMSGGLVRCCKTFLDWSGILQDLADTLYVHACRYVSADTMYICLPRISNARGGHCMGPTRFSSDTG